MKNFITTLLLVTLSGFFIPFYAQWQPHIIDPSINKPAITDVGDLDGDGDLDLGQAEWGGASIYYYRNNWPDTTWNEFLIDSNMGFPVGMVIADIDGDLTLDIVAAAGGGDKLVWYKNLGGNPINWDPYIIDSDANGIEVIYVEDMDDDNDEDITACVRNANQVCWYENLDGNGTSWRKDTIDANIVQPVTCQVFKIDKDEDMDVVACGRTYGEVVWYKNDGGIPINWIKDTLYINGTSGAFTIDVDDLDGDDDLDIAVTGYHKDNVFWLENNLPITNWTPHRIDDSLALAWVVHIADIDLDSDMDVFATGRDDDDVVWYENNLPDTNWFKHIIDDNLDGANNITSADMDFDGDSDAVVTAWDANKVLWYENPLISAPIIDPTSLQFGQVEINTSLTLPVTITNTGISVLDITNIFSNEPAFTVNLSDTTIPPRNNQEIEITFTPTEETSYNGVIEITHNAAGNPDSVTVIGNGILSSGIKDELLNTIPTDFVLHQNFPNPFNPKTSVIFGIHKASEVKLILFNSLGEEVANLFKGYKNAGYHKVEFDAAELPSGIYFYQLRVDSFVETKKMVLLR